MHVPSDNILVPFVCEISSDVGADHHRVPPSPYDHQNHREDQLLLFCILRNRARLKDTFPMSI